MIYIDFNGRCGDQFFQYAFARKIQLAINDDGKLQFNFYSVKKWRDKLNDDTFRNDLAFFNVKDNNSFVSDVENIYKYGSKKQIKLLRKYKNLYKYFVKFRTFKLAKSFQKKLQYHGIYYEDRFFDLYSYPKEYKNIFLKGHFEDYNYFKDERLTEVLRKELTPKHEVLDGDELLKIAKETNSVCVSMRSWGEVSNFNSIIKSRQVCDRNYYESAIRKIKELEPDSTIIIFSDDMEWAKRTLGGKANFYFEEKKYDICEKIVLMSSCKSFIISNSSFSWWAQYLSINNDKTVISPFKWYNDSNDKRLINPNWVIIDVER